MTANQFITQVLNINEKFYQALSGFQKDSGYFEILHASLMTLKNSISKKALEEMPMATKMAFEKLERKIFSKTSDLYQEKHNKDTEIQQIKDQEQHKTNVIGFKI